MILGAVFILALIIAAAVALAVRDRRSRLESIEASHGESEDALRQATALRAQAAAQAQANAHGRSSFLQ